ncbi:uncharacterized protein [Lolium perenne]|uniref:uncharacterized protein n=1 Tax=Lolium perenne TaxID=4522 RepID=UPI003A99241F
MASPTPPLPPSRPLWTAAEARAYADLSSSSTSTLHQNRQQNSQPPQLTPADTIADVSPFVPIVLDLSKHNFYHWRHLFHVHLDRCGLRDHIKLASTPRPTDPRWVKEDLTVIQWIYTRISTELFNLVSTYDATAAQLWAALQQPFQDNSNSRVNALHIELRTSTQGDSLVTVFCQRIKAIGDELWELDDPTAPSSTPFSLVSAINLRSKSPSSHC